MRKDAESFIVNDISPGHLREGQAKRFVSDIKRLMRYKNDFISVPCPACGSRDSNKAFEKYQMAYVICPHCETIYINPRPTPAILEIYYSKSENYRYWSRYIFPASENVRREKIFRPRVNRLIEVCKRYKITPDTLLEVGAGFGIFCQEVKRTGFFHRVIGVEPTPDLAEVCRKKGLEIIEKPIEQIVFKEGQISVVVSFEVIEHLFSPKDFLKSCISILAPRGLIILTCPNAKGFDINLLQSVSESVDAEHLNYFNLDSLSQLLTECGFEILEMSTPGKLDAERVRNAILRKGFDATPHLFLKQILIDKWETLGAKFQQFLAENKLSSHMWLVGRKP